MSRELCVIQSFLKEPHQEKIRAAALAAGIDTVRFFSKADEPGAAESLARSEVLYINDPSLLRSTSSALRWVAAANAGVDNYCTDPSLFPDPSVILTNSNVYGVTIAEHTIMVILMLLRRMPEYLQIVADHGWKRTLSIRSIRDGHFTILGTGNIGQNVAARLRGMGAAKITGLSRSGKPAEGFDEVLPISSLDEILPSTEMLIMALPSTPETIGILSKERIALLPETACVINVGRGNAVDQDALMDALNESRIAGAALDVTVPEPLPADSPLWSAKNLVLTPHVSGNLTLGYTLELNVDRFCENLANYGAGRPLHSVVDRAKGY